VKKDYGNTQFPMIHLVLWLFWGINRESPLFRTSLYLTSQTTGPWGILWACGDLMVQKC